MRAMILAAGRGERMRPLTDTQPKPLLEVGGRSLIQYHIEALARAGIEDIVINLAWQGELIRRALGNGAGFGVQIRYSHEPEGALETGGGIFAALSLLGPGPFLVISGDIWSEFPLASCVDRLAGGDVAHFVVVPNPGFHGRGDFGLEDGRLLDRAPRFTYANIG
ncbi:MAG: nucleotidyltransferase family protein, partial [Steroidobacteraceae bacterium]